MRRKITFEKIKNKPIPELSDPDEPFQRKVHVSTWFITLNSNKTSTIEHSTSSLESGLEYVLKEAFENKENLCKFLGFNTKYFGNYYELTPDMLEDTTLFPDIPGEEDSNQKLVYTFEVGEKRHRVHLHAEYRIIHYSNLTIDGEEFQRVIQEIVAGNGSLGFDSVYAHLDFVPSALPIYNYMLKGENMKYLHRKKEPDRYADDYNAAVQSLMKIRI